MNSTNIPESQLDRQLATTLESWPLFADGEATLTVTDGVGELTCALTTLDSLGCAFVSLVLLSPRIKGLSATRLQQIAAALSARLTYLLEPINPIETDAERSVVQMRSTPPSKQADRTDYYELLVTAEGAIALRRYSRPRGAAREVVPANVTREVLVRLAGDLARAAAAA